MRKGSLVRATGIYIVKTDELRYPRVFQIALRSPEDVQVLQAAPWWTQTYAVTAAKLLVGLAVATSIWVVLLRRRIKAQTQLIRQELRREAALEVRYRSLVETANGVEALRMAEGNHQPIDLLLTELQPLMNGPSTRRRLPGGNRANLNNFRDRFARGAGTPIIRIP